MHTTRTTILGISPGTRYIGLALLQNKRLQDRRLKAFNGKWSNHKQRIIIRTIERYIESQTINVIAITIVPDSKGSKNLSTVIDGIKQIAERNQIQIYSFSTTELKQNIHSGTRVTKETLVEHILQLYPELNREYRKEQKNIEGYHIKVFEAVAVARMTLDQRLQEGI